MLIRNELVWEIMATLKALLKLYKCYKPNSCNYSMILSEILSALLLSGFFGSGLAVFSRHRIHDVFLYKYSLNGYPYMVSTVGLFSFQSSAGKIKKSYLHYPDQNINFSSEFFKSQVLITAQPWQLFQLQGQSHICLIFMSVWFDFSTVPAHLMALLLHKILLHKM